MSSMAKSSSSASSSSSFPPCVATDEDEAYDTTARTLLEEKGFDPEEDVNKACRVRGFGWTTFYTPINYFSKLGNLQMCRYLILCRGADCRTTDSHGYSPMLWAACYGHLEIIQFLCHECDEDIRKPMWNGFSPLILALQRGHFQVVWWLILNGALSSSPHDAVDGTRGGIDDAIMRNDLRPIQDHFCYNWENDNRLTVLSWVQDAVTNHENVKLFLTGTIISSASFHRHPKNPYATRSNKKRKVATSSPLVILKGKSGILALIAHYVVGTQKQLRTQRQLLNRLPAFIANVPFVEREDEDENDYSEFC